MATKTLNQFTKQEIVTAIVDIFGYSKDDFLLTNYDKQYIIEHFNANQVLEISGYLNPTAQQPSTPPLGC